MLRPQPLSLKQNKKGKKPNRTIARQHSRVLNCKPCPYLTQPIGKSWNTCSMCIRVLKKRKKKWQSTLSLAYEIKEADEFISIGRCNNIDNDEIVASMDCNQSPRAFRASPVTQSTDVISNLYTSHHVSFSRSIQISRTQKYKSGGGKRKSNLWMCAFYQLFSKISVVIFQFNSLKIRPALHHYIIRHLLLYGSLRRNVHAGR